ncbi:MULTISPECIES: hypothetical protein [unclassified Streptomyces]|uniref:hypothetical protein n=1 Tax=unclassified Streptomyces TaxID=2593676 RepID=UPI002741F602|nr:MULTISPECIES: hypothetical protein [unclassified Streptomyces]
MRKRRKDRGRAKPVHLALCDLCAASFPEDEATSGYVPDSSCAYPTRHWFDGLRLVTACCDEHFETIREEYRHRPFVQEELWAAKITCALTVGRAVLSLEELGCRTGLHEPEIRRAMAWHNKRMRPADDGV